MNIRPKKRVTLLYGFAFFDPFMIVIPLLVPYLATHGISMRQFMELQAVFAFVILCGEVPCGLLSDLWGRKRTLLLGSALKAVSFALLPLWSTYEGFLCYHLTMGIALSMISGGDVALLYESYLAAGGDPSRGTTLLGNAKLAEQAGMAVSALLGGAIVTLSYGHLLWMNAVFSWIPVLLVLCVAEPPASPDRGKARSRALAAVFSAALTRDAVTRLVFVNLVVWGLTRYVMVWMNQKYWQDIGVPLAYFGVLWASHNLIVGLAGKSVALAGGRYGRRRLLAAAGLSSIIGYLGMASFVSWGGIAWGTLIQVSRGLGEVLFMDALIERVPATFRATVISLANLGIRAAFCLLGPLVGYGADGWGLPAVLAALGIFYAIAFALLLLPLIVRPLTRRLVDGVGD